MPYPKVIVAEKQRIWRLVTSECANYDPDYGCLPIDDECYMSTIAFVNSSLCKYFKAAVLPLDPELQAVFFRRPLKACKRCGDLFPINGRQTYCDACAAPVRKAADAARARKYRGQTSRIGL